MTKNKQKQLETHIQIRILHIITFSRILRLNGEKTVADGCGGLCFKKKTATEPIKHTKKTSEKN